MASLYYEVPATIASDLASASAIVPFSPPPYIQDTRCYVTVQHWNWQPENYPEFKNVVNKRMITLPCMQFRLESDLPQGQSQSCRFINNTDTLSIGQRNVPLGMCTVYRANRDSADAAPNAISTVESVSSGPIEIFIPSGLQQIKFSVYPCGMQYSVAATSQTETTGIPARLTIQLSITTLDKK